MEGWKLWMSLCRRRHAPGGQLPTLTQAHSLKFKEVKGKRRSPLRVNMIYKRKQATSKMTSHRIQAGGRVSCACCGVHVWVVGCRDNMPCQTLPLGVTTWLPLDTAYPSRPVPSLPLPSLPFPFLRHHLHVLGHQCDRHLGAPRHVNHVVSSLAEIMVCWEGHVVPPQALLPQGQVLEVPLEEGLYGQDIFQVRRLPDLLVLEAEVVHQLRRGLITGEG